MKKLLATLLISLGLMASAQAQTNPAPAGMDQTAPMVKKKAKKAKVHKKATKKAKQKMAHGKAKIAHAA